PTSARIASRRRAAAPSGASPASAGSAASPGASPGHHARAGARQAASGYGARGMAVTAKQIEEVVAEGDDPVEAARAAGLRHVSDARPGITRKRSGKGFVYAGPDGRTIRDEAELRRIRALAVPPAWTGVWICPDPRGHIQATGRDARGRKQYRYHTRWREVRDETKYGRMVAFGEALPGLRKRVSADLRKEGLPREKVLAAVLRLLESTLIRV